MNGVCVDYRGNGDRVVVGRAEDIDGLCYGSLVSGAIAAAGAAGVECGSERVRVMVAFYEAVAGVRGRRICSGNGLCDDVVGGSNVRFPVVCRNGDTGSGGRIDADSPIAGGSVLDSQSCSLEERRSCGNSNDGGASVCVEDEFRPKGAVVGSESLNCVCEESGKNEREKKKKFFQ